jgi:hypothetical protein
MTVRAPRAYASPPRISRERAIGSTRLVRSLDYDRTACYSVRRASTGFTVVAR